MLLASHLSRWPTLHYLFSMSTTFFCSRVDSIYLDLFIYMHVVCEYHTLYLSVNPLVLSVLALVCLCRLSGFVWFLTCSGSCVVPADRFSLSGLSAIENWLLVSKCPIDLNQWNQAPEP